MASLPRVFLYQTITTLRPYYLASVRSWQVNYQDRLLGVPVSSVDLGAIFWDRTLRREYLLQGLEAIGDPGQPAGEYARVAIDALPAVRKILGAAESELPPAQDLVFAYRVILECARVASLAQRGYHVHLARGLVSQECNQYDLEAILGIAEHLGETAIGQLIGALHEDVEHEPGGPALAVIHVRNDGELYQAVGLAAWLRHRFPNMKVALDAAGANEQYSFGEWLTPFRKYARRMAAFVDYFIARQDYGASLRALIGETVLRMGAGLERTGNIFEFADPDSLERSPAPSMAQIDAGFERYARDQPTFLSGGRRTILTRLAPDRCHWSACSFCTINSQHLMPRGHKVVNARFERQIFLLIERIKADGIQSVILTDEALHPRILAECARRFLAAGVKIIFRARARFTNDFTPEVCGLLAEAGCRFLGLGLEAASPRVNALFNKHLGRPIDYDRVLANLDCAGINAHVYAIIGFPTETLEEMRATRDFLVAAIERYRYLTVSANIFYLMRGSPAASRPQDFGITSIKGNGDIGLVCSFDAPGRAERATDADACAREVFEAEFMPGLGDPYMAWGYWSFIDQTGLFYLEKVEYEHSPYLAMAHSRERILPADFADAKYQRSRVFRLTSLDTESRVGIADWVSGSYGRVPAHLARLVTDYDERISLRSNVAALVDKERMQEAFVMFPKLYRMGLFVQRAAFAKRFDGGPRMTGGGV